MKRYISDKEVDKVISTLCTMASFGATEEQMRDKAHNLLKGKNPLDTYCVVDIALREARKHII